MTRVVTMVSLIHGQVAVEASGQYQLDNSRYASFTSSLAPLLPNHNTAVGNDIVDHHLDESAITERSVESRTTVWGPLSPWDPISDNGNLQGLGSCESVEQVLTRTASSPKAAKHQVTETVYDTQSIPRVETCSSLPDDSTPTDVSTVYSAELLSAFLNGDSVPSICLDDSREPLLRKAFCTRIAQSIGNPENSLRDSQNKASRQLSDTMTTSKNAALLTTSMLNDNSVKAGPLPSSTLFGRALRSSPKITSRFNTQTTSSTPFADVEQRSVLSKSTEDIIRLIYDPHSFTEPNSSISLQEPIEHNHGQSPRSKDPIRSKRKSVQWQDRELYHPREDVMSDILDAYLEHDFGEDKQKALTKLNRHYIIAPKNFSYRDREKATAKMIFRATQDWQDLDKISRFLRATKNLK